MKSLNQLFAAIALTALSACAPADVAPPIGDSEAPVRARAIEGMDGVTRDFEVGERRVGDDGLRVDFMVDGWPLTLRIDDGEPRYVEVFAVDGGALLSVEQAADGTTRAVDAEGHVLFGHGGIPRCYLTDSVDADVIATVEGAALAFLGDTSGSGQAGIREAREVERALTIMLGCPGAECEAEGWDGGAKCCCKVGQSCNYGVKNGTGYCYCSDNTE